MTTPQERAFAEVKKLAADFRANESFFSSPDYQEQEARRDFIDKFFIAMGWDVNHDLQKSPYEQEVKVERGVHVSGARKRADYAFYILPKTHDVRFFVEAKKPHGELATPDHYFQTIRYGWNANTPLAVLTDFSRLHVLDCRFKPNIATALQRAVKTFDYNDYGDPEKFAEIFHLLSRDSVAAGSLDNFAAALPKPRGKSVQAAPGVYKGIDEAFLEELDEHRYSLAHMFKDADASLDGEALTEITQRALDRLVFIRFLEDRLIEPEPVVSRFGEKGSAWGDFLAASRRLDGIYNGIVFKKHSVLDSPDLKVDDKKFTAICRELSHEHSPYDFNIIPIHILGSIYERFLGKVITAGDKRARVEEKPEVRKAGGVYYTPQYIVKYIVDNTVGKMIEGKNPEQIAGMRFADISCGSGSFLLGVFDTLLDCHRRYYNKFRSKAKKDECVERDGALHLTLKKRREILLNNVFGVDIDAQAVEVAQLSLYLKLLEEETVGTAREHQREFHEAILPSLAANIVCGNSLIGTDVLTGQLFAGDEERKLNPMDFEARFPEIMRAGGFNAIVGNPPWGAEFSEVELAYHRQKNKEIIVRMIDSFMYFVYQATKRIQPNGYLGMILPDVILYQGDNEALRKYLLNMFRVEAMLNMGNVFQKVTRPACILSMKRSEDENGRVLVADFTKLTKEEKMEAILDRNRFEAIHQNDLKAIPGTAFITHAPTQYAIWNKVRRGPCDRLEDLIDEDGIQRGVSPDLKEAFIVESKTASERRLEKDYLRRVLTGGRQVRRYHIERSDYRLIYTCRETDTSACPNIRAYIDQFARQITCKEVKQRKHSLYALHRAREERIFTKKIKFLGVITEDEIIIAPDDTGVFATDGLYLFGLRENMNGNFLMGILNSHLFVFIYRLLALESGRVLAQVKPTVLGQLPIRKVDQANAGEKVRHEEIVRLVDAMLVAKAQLSDAKTDKDKTYYEQKCAALDRQIDDLVYKLYGLTDDEIRIVEAGQ